MILLVDRLIESLWRHLICNIYFLLILFRMGMAICLSGCMQSYVFRFPSSMAECRRFDDCDVLERNHH